MSALGTNSVPSWVLSGAAADMDFANGLYWSGSLTTVGSLLTTTRASTGYAATSTGGLTLFQANVPRITDLGLLVEEARTNLVTQSQTFSTWTPSNTTITANSATAPDGTVTATLYKEDTSTGVHRLTIASITGVSAGGNTFTVYVKPDTGRYVYLSDNGSTGVFWSAVFDLQGGGSTATQTAVGGTAGTIVSTSQAAVANGLYRISVTGFKGVTTCNPLIGLTTAATGNTYDTFGQISTVGTSKQVYIWGAQFEAAAFATSYIPTTTVAVTRAADSIALAGNALTTAVALSKVSAWMYGRLISSPDSSTGSGILSVNDGSGSNAVQFLDNSSGLVRGLIAVSGATTVSINAGSPTANTAVKGAFSWSATAAAIAVNGGVATTGVNTSLPTAQNQAVVGVFNASINPINNYVKRLALGAGYIGGSGVRALSAQ